jgi:hypothetical protein
MGASGKRNSCLQGAASVGSCHRWSCCHVAGPSSNLQSNESVEFLGVRVDSNVDDHNFDSELSAENVNRCAAREKVQDHLARNRLWIRTYSFLGHTVIGGKGEDDLIRTVWKFFFADHYKLGCNRLEAPEAS